MLERVPDTPNGWYDPEHPERGHFFCKEGLTAEQVEVIWVESVKTDPAEPVRLRRDLLLKESDWTQLPDAPVDQARWAIYRQALRDLDMTNPDWPAKPEGDVSDEEKLRVERVLDRAARTILFDGKN